MSMSDTMLNEVQYRDFSLDIHQKAGEKNIPVKGQIELTFQCNLKCVHCYMPEEKTGTELGFQEITNILDQIHLQGCLWLALTGGDPLMRKDFPDIYDYAKRKGFLITILTSGTLMTPELADSLAEKPPFSIDLTLNGVTQETYEKISQVPGSFRRAMEAIHLILDRKLPLKIKTKATSLNYHELKKIKGFVENLGMEFNPSTTLYPGLDGSLDPCNYRLSPEQISGLNGDIQDKNECDENDLNEDDFIPPDNLIRCAAGINSFHISPYGELIFCTFMRKPNFNLQNGSFKQGFYTLYPEIRSAKYQTDSQCKTCEKFYLCSQCPAVAELESGDPEKPIEYFCNLTHKQKELDRVAGLT